MDYTEGGFGFETTSILLWTFNPESPIPSITSISVGDDDSPSWLGLTFQEVDHSDYCEVHVQMCADIAGIPTFIMNWMSTTATELAKTYRDIIQGAVEQSD